MIFGRYAHLLHESWFRMRGYYPTSILGLPFRCDTDHVGFWRSVSKGRWEPETYRVLSRMLKPDTVYCDIGAWIGPTVLYAARRCGRVYCFEPDIYAFRHLIRNIELNNLSNVMTFNLALADMDGTIRLGRKTNKPGDSTSSMLLQNHADLSALSMTWEHWFRLVNPGRIDVVKMDIEGAEFSLLPCMGEYLAETKPTLYLSTHAPLLPENQRHEHMERIAKVARLYRNCFDEQLNPVSVEVMTEQKSLQFFRAFLFED